MILFIAEVIEVMQ